MVLKTSAEGLAGGTCLIYIEKMEQESPPTPITIRTASLSIWAAFLSQDGNIEQSGKGPGPNGKRSMGYKEVGRVTGSYLEAAEFLRVILLRPCFMVYKVVMRVDRSGIPLEYSANKSSGWPHCSG